MFSRKMFCVQQRLYALRKLIIYYWFPKSLKFNFGREKSGRLDEPDTISSWGKLKWSSKKKTKDKFFSLFVYEFIIFQSTSLLPSMPNWSISTVINNLKKLTTIKKACHFNDDLYYFIWANIFTMRNNIVQKNRPSLGSCKKTCSKYTVVHYIW